MSMPHSCRAGSISALVRRAPGALEADRSLNYRVKLEKARPSAWELTVVVVVVVGPVGAQLCQLHAPAHKGTNRVKLWPALQLVAFGRDEQRREGQGLRLKIAGAQNEIKIAA